MRSVSLARAESDAALRTERCAVCDGALEAAIDLPSLPLTETYCREPVSVSTPGIDQRLLFCPECGHGQLGTQLAPEVLYGANYAFRTSASATARRGTQFFLSVLDEFAAGRRFKCVLDLGCNDLYLLSQLGERVGMRIGVDPVWRGKEAEREDESIVLYGANIEEVALATLPEKPDLVVCRHTLEHIRDPRRVLDLLMAAAAPDALFVFEVPGFDALLSRLRFDQIFHQHLHYFSLASFSRLVRGVGARVLAHRYNIPAWGGMAGVGAGPGAGTGGAPPPARPSASQISDRYRLFRQQTRNAGAVLAGLHGTRVYGYGAAQMLPVLGYHMDTDFAELAAVLDDDPARDGIGYWNLPVNVIHSSRAQRLSESSVLITAVDNVQPIMARLLADRPSERPRHILYPFHII